MEDVRFKREQWIVKSNRPKIVRNPETGYYDILHPVTGEKIGNTQTRQAAFIARRKWEARGGK